MVKHSYPSSKRSHRTTHPSPSSSSLPSTFANFPFTSVPSSSPRFHARNRRQTASASSSSSRSFSDISSSRSCPSSCVEMRRLEGDQRLVEESAKTAASKSQSSSQNSEERRQSGEITKVMARAKEQGTFKRRIAPHLTYCALAQISAGNPKISAHCAACELSDKPSATR